MSHPLWSMDYSEVVFNFQRMTSLTAVFVIDFYLNSIMIWEQTLYNFISFKLIEVCFMAQNMIYLGRCLAVVGWNVVYILIGYCWLFILFRPPGYLLTFWLVLSAVESRLLKSSAIGLWICLFFLLGLSVFASHIWNLCCLVGNLFIIIIHSW